MSKINNSQLVYSSSNVYNTFFFDGKCYVLTTEDMSEIYKLDSMACKDDKIIIINEIQEIELREKGFSHNGFQKIELDNLDHIYVQKYILKSPDGDIRETTELIEIRDENDKYSHFLRNLILEHYYINHMSFENISEFLKLNYDLDIDAKRVCDLYYKTVDSFITKKVEDVEEDIKNGKIELGQVGNYDEEFTWYNHQPVVRLTLLDYKTKLILNDIIIPRKEFNREYIKMFIQESIEGLDYHTIVTDGDNRYKKILDELNLNQQRCIFHSMQNLMAKLNPVHNRLKRKIKSINKKIAKKENELAVLEKKYEGCVGRPKRGDTKRKNDIKKMRKLRTDLSNLKAERSEYNHHIDDDNKIVKKISRLLKSKTYETGMKLFDELWEKKDTFSNEIASHLKNLKEYLPQALTHTLYKDVPRTNNLIESFFKATLPRKIKYIFRTFNGLVKRVILADLRWTENVIREHMEKEHHQKIG